MRRRASRSLASGSFSVPRGVERHTRSDTPPVSSRRVTGLVLAAGGSKRLGQPKQLLPYAGTTLLGHVLDVARASEFDQLLCVIGGGGEEVLRQTRFDGVEVVENRGFGEGCSSSI